MQIISINTGSTERGIKEFNKFFYFLCKEEDAVYARVRYRTNFLTQDNAHPLTYPLVIYTANDIAFCLADVTAGYGGTGPQGMVKVLKELGFNFDKNDILEKQLEVKLDFVKENVVLREPFKHYDIPYISYLDRPFIKK